MPLDPFYADRLPFITGITDWKQGLSDPTAAERLARWGAIPADYQPPAVAVSTAVAPGPHGPVPVRVYRPVGQRLATGQPGLVWVHGGGFVAGDLDMPEAHLVAAEIAVRGPAVVVSVDYRLALDGVHYPVPHDDVLAAFRWARENSPALGIDGRLSIGGASAGGNLSAGVTQHLRDDGDVPPHTLLLAYPVCHRVVPPDDSVEKLMAPLPGLLRFSPRMIAEMNANYLGDSDGAYAFPAEAGLATLPPIAVVTSEYDDLRPSGEAFGRDVRAAGGRVTSWMAPGAPHGHLNNAPVIAPIVGTLERFAAALA